MPGVNVMLSQLKVCLISLHLHLTSIVESNGLRNGPNYDGATLVFFPVNENTNYKSIVLVPGYKAEQEIC